MSKYLSFAAKGAIPVAIGMVIVTIIIHLVQKLAVYKEAA